MGRNVVEFAKIGRVKVPIGCNSGSRLLGGCICQSS